MSRPQENSRLIGWTKKPRLERGPKLNNPIAQPQMMITSGVRQLGAAGDRRRAPSVAAMQNSFERLGGSRERFRRARGANAAGKSARGEVNASA